MSLSRRQRFHISMMDSAERNKSKPLPRKVVHQWLAPIRKAFTELATGYVDTVDGHVITTIAWAGNEEARVDECINGFVSMVNRIDPAFDTNPMTIIANHLTNDELFTHEEIVASFACLKGCEDLLISRPRREVYDASVAEQIAISVHSAGLLEE